MTTDASVPAGWVATTLGELVTIIRGVSYDKADAAKVAGDGLIPILRATNIDETLNFDEFVYVPKRYISQVQMLRTGDIVIAASSGSQSVVGKAAQLTTEWAGSFGAFCMGLRTASEIDNRFVAYFLQSTEYRRRVSLLAAGSNINNLKREHIQSCPLRLAPRPEQARIVAKVEELFSELDTGVAALKRAKANLKRYRAAVLKAAVEGKLTEEWRKQNPATDPADKLLARILDARREKWEQEQICKYAEAGKPPPKGWRERYKQPAVPSDKLASLPTGWVWASVEQVSTKVVDGVHKKPTYVQAGIPFVTVRNLTAGPGISFDRLNYITREDHEEFIKRTNPEKGDILVSKDGTLGVIRVIKTDTTFSIFVSVALIKPVFYECSDYIGLALSSTQVQRQMVPKGSGLQHIHLEDLREDALPLAPLLEQKEISVEVDRRLSVIDAIEIEVEHGLRRAARLRQAILKRAFEGRLVPQDDTDEPADKLLERLRVRHDDSTPDSQRLSPRPRRKSRSTNMTAGMKEGMFNA